MIAIADRRDAHAPPTAGSGVATLHIARAGDRSVVGRAYAPNPLKLLLPRNHGTGAWVYLSTYGGGMVDGDAVRLDIDVAAGALAMISTQASTKIYRSPGGVTSTIAARVRGDGVLVVAPDPVVAFAGARYRQTQTFAMDDEASLIHVDWLTSGRCAMGERWAFSEYVSRLTIQRGGALLVHDALRLHQSDGDLAARLGRFDVLAAVVLVGPAVREAACAIVTAVAASPIGRRADLLTSAAELRDAGCILRLAGTSVEAVGRSLRAHLNFVPALLGDDPWARKW